jgi:hypothetical protein
MADRKYEKLLIVATHYQDARGFMQERGLTEGQDALVFLPANGHKLRGFRGGKVHVLDRSRDLGRGDLNRWGELMRIVASMQEGASDGS